MMFDPSPVHQIDCVKMFQIQVTLVNFLNVLDQLSDFRPVRQRQSFVHLHRSGGAIAGPKVMTAWILHDATILMLRDSSPFCIGLPDLTIFHWHLPQNQLLYPVDRDRMSHPETRQWMTRERSDVEEQVTQV